MCHLHVGISFLLCSEVKLINNTIEQRLEIEVAMSYRESQTGSVSAKAEPYCLRGRLASALLGPYVPKSE